MTGENRDKIMKIARLVAVFVVIIVGVFGYITQSKKKDDETTMSDVDVIETTAATTVAQNETTAATTTESASTEEITEENSDDFDYNPTLYSFRRQEFLDQHFEKHGGEFDYATKEEYVAGANRVIQNPKALHKTEAEDGDDIYFIEETNEFVVVSTDGYIRTYFIASGGIDYYNRQ